MFNHVLESSQRDYSNKWSNIGFGEEITQGKLIEIHLTHHIWSSVFLLGNFSFSETIMFHYLSKYGVNSG